MTDPTQPEPPEAARPAPRPRALARHPVVRAAAELTAVGLTTLAVVGFGVYASRREVAQDLAERWLAEQGLSGALEVERLDADGFSGRLRVGPESDPDLAVERVEVDLGLEPAWSDTPFRLSTRAVRLYRPQLKARLDGRGLSFGRLDPVVRDFLARPDTDDGPGPRVRVEQGSVRLYTPYGPLRISGSGSADDGKLVRLDARVQPVRLKGEGLTATLGAGQVRLTGQGGRLSGRATAPITAWDGWGLQAQGADLSLDLDAAYPQGAGLAIDGPLTAEATLSGARLAGGGVVARDGRVRLAFAGRAEGPLARLRLTGVVDGAAAASSATSGELRASDVRVTTDALQVDLAREATSVSGALAGSVRGGAARVAAGKASVQQLRFTASSGRATLSGRNDAIGFTGPVRVQAQATRAGQGVWTAAGLAGTAATDLAIFGGRSTGLSTTLAAASASGRLDAQPVALSDVRLVFAGPARLDEGLRWRATGEASGRGALSPASAAATADRIPVLGGEDSHRTAITAALAGFDVHAPRLTLTVEGDEASLYAVAPASLRARSGAVLTVASPAGRPVWATRSGGPGGDLLLSAQGGGLPTGTLALEGWRATGDGFSSGVRLSAQGLNAAIARDATVQTRGSATLAGERFSFVAAGCFPMTAAEIEFGENDLTDAAAEVCPTGAPLVATDRGGYRLRGRFQRASLAWPVAEARGGDASGAFDIRGGQAGLSSGEVRLAAATVADAAAETRYAPLSLSGGIDLRGGVWRGRFDGASASGARLGSVDVTHADGTGVGSAVIDARGIAFAEGGLQPEQLSPLVAGIAANATGTLDFTGRVDWTEAGSTSEGRLTTAGVDFRSPAGGVSQVTADVAFTSLTPLISAPQQEINIRRVDALAEITDATTKVTIGPEAIVFDSTRFGVAGGLVRIDSFSVPLDGSGVYSGVVVVEGVQLGEVMAALNLGDKIGLDAVVAGRVPFEVAPGRIRFAEGRLAATRPGRVEISRESLTGVSAAGGAAAPTGEAAPVNAVQEFAYQAMENLAFDTLELEVNSLPEGRLGLLFRVKGEHDPAVAEEARVGFFEALRGRAFERRIPLPKGTPVNLTLDTTVNFDDLLQAWLDIARRRTAEAEAEAERSAPVQPAPPTPAP